jgi:hypothetical protein
MWHAEIREWLGARMAERRMESTAELARHVGMSAGAVADRRRGHDRPSPANRLRLAAASDRPPEGVGRAAGYGG